MKFIHYIFVILLLSSPLVIGFDSKCYLFSTGDICLNDTSIYSVTNNWTWSINNSYMLENSTLNQYANEGHTAYGWGDWSTNASAQQTQISSLFASLGNLHNYSFSEIAANLGNWSEDQINYYNSTEVDALPISTFTNDEGYLTTSDMWSRSGENLYPSDLSNNVGIGTTSPGSKLEIYGTGGVTQKIVSNNTGEATLILDGNSNSVLSFHRAGIGERFKIYRPTATNDLRFSDDAGDVMTIKDGGNVGIGTTSPGYSLHIYHATTNEVSRFESGDNGAFIRVKDDDTDVLLNAEGGYASLGGNAALNAANLNIELSSGNVGIGTTSPESKLHVDGSEYAVQDYSGAGGANLIINSDGSYAEGTGGSIALGGQYNTGGSHYNWAAIKALKYNSDSGSANGGMAFYTRPSSAGLQQQVTINKDGNVGIGTTNPARQLSIIGAGTTSILQLGNSVTGAASDRGLELFTSSENAGISNRENGYIRIDTNNTERARITNSGKFGIGTTSPRSKFDVTGGDINIDDGENMQWGDGTTFISGHGSSDYLRFITANSEALRITSSGNVGIGTTSPDGKLHVQSASAGTVDADSNYDDLVVENNNHGGISILTPADKYGGILFGDGTGSAAYRGNIRYTHSSDYLGLGSAGNFDELVIKSGNVGIGTTSPNAPLTVQKTYAVGDYSFSTDFKDDSGTYGFLMGVKTGTAKGVISARGSGQDLLFRTISTGDIYFDAGATGFTDGTPDMTILSDGNVGIGTTSPEAKLSIEGANNLAFDATNIAGQVSNGATAYITNTGGGTNGFAQLVFGHPADTSVSRIASINAGTGTTDLAFVTESGSVVGEKMRITSSGNVGIGTTSPEAKLDIVGDGTNFGLQIANTENGDGIKVVTANATVNNGFVWQQGTDNMVNFYSDTGNDAKLKLYNSNVGEIQLATGGEDSYINSGNVGIGTTAPGERLHLLGSSAVYQKLQSASTSHEAGLIFQQGASSKWLVRSKAGNDFDFYSYQEGASVLTLDGDTGNVGIGTTNPGAKLQISGSTSDTPGSDWSFAPHTYWGYRIGTGTVNEALTLDRQAGGVSYAVMTWDRIAGNVGIGTTAPAQKLEVAGNIGIRSNNALHFNSETGGGFWKVYPSATTAGNLYIDRYSSGYKNVMTMLLDSGYVGIGTTAPDKELHIVSDSHTYAEIEAGTDSLAGIYLTNDVGSWILKNDGNNGDKFILRKSVGGSVDVLTADTSGNVGIGTTSPTHDLHVVGDINATGTIYYGALQAQSPHAFLPDDEGYTRICLVAENGDIVMQTLGFDKKEGYVWKYIKDHPDCLAKTVTTKEIPIYENETIMVNKTQTICENVTIQVPYTEEVMENYSYEEEKCDYTKTDKGDYIYNCQNITKQSQKVKEECTTTYETKCEYLPIINEVLVNTTKQDIQRFSKECKQIPITTCNPVTQTLHREEVQTSCEEVQTQQEQINKVQVGKTLEKKNLLWKK